MTKTMKKRLEQLENGVIDLCTTASQLKESLCGNKKATNKELLAAVDQLKSRLAQVGRERDAAVRDMSKAVRENGVCIACKHDKPFDNNCEENDFDCANCKSPCMCQSCHIGSNYEWRGPCPENTPDPAKE